jgi:hypothetical protein
MRPAALPIVSTVLDFGADDAIFNGLLLSGPILLAVVVLLDRSVITVGLATAYIVLLVLYVLYLGATSDPEDIPN